MTLNVSILLGWQAVFEDYLLAVRRRGLVDSVLICSEDMLKEGFRPALHLVNVTTPHVSCLLHASLVSLFARSEQPIILLSAPESQ